VRQQLLWVLIMLLACAIIVPLALLGDPNY
jgi:hypothetical protein